MIGTLFLLAACGAVPAINRPPLETVDQFAIHARGSTMAGLAAVVVENDTITLQALSPAGLQIFTVQASSTDVAVSAANEDMKKVLERMPFYRDLSLLYRWRCEAKRCKTDLGSIRQKGATEWVWHGKGGRALLTLENGNTQLHDPLRGYTLKVVGEGVHD